MSNQLTLNPYLAFNGQCEEAFKFYEQCLGGKITAMMTNEASPMGAQMPPEARKKIMHACLEIGDQRLMGGDAPAGHDSKPHGFCVSVHIADLAQAERVFQALSAQGTIQMPFQATFWSAGFGMLTDRFGIPWMVNCTKAGAAANA